MNHLIDAATVKKKVVDVDAPSVVVVQSDGTMSARALPPYGELRIVTHGGKITMVETVTKEKVE